MIVLVCGVSGTGKSTVGELLAKKLSLPFYDGDDFHPEENVQKMKSGIALNDNDRAPWLNVLASQIEGWEKEAGAVLACSALKESYRQILSSKCRSGITWVFLNGSADLLSKRLGSRKDHFFNPALLQSQFATLELPDYGWVMDVKPSPQVIVNNICTRIDE